MPAPAGNKYALGNEGGRPRIYETPEELAAAVEGYFIYCQGEYEEIEQAVVSKGKGKGAKPTEEKVKVRKCIRPPESYTITGLALYLGFASRSTLDDYEAREEYSYIVKRAKMVVENRYENGLSSSTPTGPIFALKNMGWKDKQEVENSGEQVLVWKEEKTYAAKPKANKRT